MAESPGTDPSDEVLPDGVSSEGVRLQKVLAQAGIASRRAAEAMIVEGRVRVDNVVVTELGTRVDPATAVVHVDGERVPTAPGLVVVAMNKPRGVVTSMSDDRGRPCVGDMVADRPERLFHVGRLDAETEGLLLLTNDGELTNRLLHPSHEVAKTYRARVDGAISKQAMRALGSGIDLDDGPIACDSARVIQRFGRPKPGGGDAALGEEPHRSPDVRRGGLPGSGSGAHLDRSDLIGQPQAWPGGRGSRRSTAIPLHGRRAVTGSTRFPRDRYPRDP